MYAVFKRELFSFLSSMVAYITIGIFLIVAGLLLWFFPETAILDYGYAELDGFFSLVPYLFMFLVPAITMRAFAEEQREGTYELLITKPISQIKIILAKYFACLVLVFFALLPTLIYCFSIAKLGYPAGNLDTGAIIGAYIGLFFLGASFTAMGIFASALTKNQIIAFVICAALCAFAYLGFDYSSQIPALQKIQNFIMALGINQHYVAVSRGVLDTRDLLYFFSFSVLFVVLTHLIVGGKRS